MPWPITYHDVEPADYQIGDMWPEPGFAHSRLMSDHYRTVVAPTRMPLMLVLPGKNGMDLFPIDRIVSGGDGRGWNVTIVGELVDGQKPDVTITPSINCTDSYHGHVTNGVITDDVDGRTF